MPLFFLYRTQLPLVMDVLILRFPHVAEKIFQQQDNKSLAKCREVKKLWQNFIDERNYPWLRIVNIPTILQDGNTYIHLAAQCGQTDMFEIILDKEENENAKNHSGKTPFFVACSKGHLQIALMLMRKTNELHIDLKAKDDLGWTPFHKDYDGRTAFHRACSNGHLDIAEMIIKTSTGLNIDLNIRDNDGRTAFHLACSNGHLDIAEIIIKASTFLNIDLNIRDNVERTAFHLACFSGHSEITEVTMKMLSELNRAVASGGAGVGG